MPRKPRFGCIYRPAKILSDGTRKENLVWWIAYYHRGGQVRESSKSKRHTDAEALLRQRLVEIETGSYASAARRITVATLLDALLLDYETNGKAIALARYIDGHLAARGKSTRKNKVLGK